MSALDIWENFLLKSEKFMKVEHEYLFHSCWTS